MKENEDNTTYRKSKCFFMLNGVQNTIADTYVKHDGN